MKKKIDGLSILHGFTKKGEAPLSTQHDTNTGAGYDSDTPKKTQTWSRKKHRI